MSRKLKVLIKACIVTLLILAPLTIWLQQDEEPLNYDSMTVASGPNDPTINGYTLMCDFANSYETRGMDDYELAQEDRVADWDIKAVRSAIDQNQELLKTYSKALSMDIFLRDQPATPDTIYPEISHIRDYLNLSINIARLNGYDGDLDQEFSQLFHLSKEVEIYAQLKGPLIHLLTSMATTGILEEQYYRLLEMPLSQKQCLQLVKEYPSPQMWSDIVKDAYRQEFWFASHYVDMIQRDPSAFFSSGMVSQTKAMLLYSKILFKTTQTKNSFFDIYSEVLSEAHKPNKERTLVLIDRISNEEENRPFGWWFSRNIAGKMLFTDLMSSTRKVLELVDQRIANSQSLRIAYALKSYYNQNGTLPEKLSALIPEYMKAIPLDPFDGEPMRYSKERGIVYSVGNDYIDNGGSELPFSFTVPWEDRFDIYAEYDKTEPTFALRFLPQFHISQK